MSSSSSLLSPGAHTVIINDLKIHYNVQSDSPSSLPPLIVHPPPWGVGADMYVSTFGRLSSRFTLIVPSPRGNDSSDTPTDPSAMSTRHIVQDLEALRVHLGLEKVSLAGHSAGGVVVLGYAIAYPQHVDRLVLIETDLLGYTRKDQSFFAKVGKIFSSMSVTNDAEFRTFVLKMMHLYFAHPQNGGPEAFEKAWTALPKLSTYGAYYAADQTEGGKWDQLAELGRVTAKTLVVVGRQDRTCGVEVAETVAHGVKGSNLIVLEDCGHFPWVEQENKFWDIVDGFLRG
ncbi:uncharacterized protein PV06_00772 [Exophiala oligosperma]|uniref:AB hydrolase-1 domain-containing protein n=1 Tax=Exophiala oligosperma TaxID=215243 RepID=A0A0D2EJR4_9EURO|nr:uncharacterized protein PV06_00772 [Exophiala oligosperma]KIW48154.1 hypothetical protein PV06_00772 [Exophiala oligosperma]